MQSGNNTNERIKLRKDKIKKYGAIEAIPLQEIKSISIANDDAQFLRQEHEQEANYYRLAYYGADEKGEIIYEIDYSDKVRVRFLSEALDCFYVAILEGKRYASCLYTSLDIQPGLAVRLCQDSKGIWVKPMQDVPQAARTIPQGEANPTRKKVYCLSPVTKKNNSTGEVKYIIDFTRTVRYYSDKENKMHFLHGQYADDLLYVRYREDMPLRKVTHPVLEMVDQFDVKNISYEKCIEKLEQHPSQKNPWQPQERKGNAVVTYGRVLTDSDAIKAGKTKKMAVDYGYKLEVRFLDASTVKLRNIPNSSWLRYDYTPLGAFQDGSLVRFVEEHGKGFVEIKYSFPPIRNILPFTPKKYRFTRVERYHHAALFELNSNDVLTGCYVPQAGEKFRVQSGYVYENQLYVRQRVEISAFPKFLKYEAFTFDKRGTEIFAQARGFFAEVSLEDKKFSPVELSANKEKQEEEVAVTSEEKEKFKKALAEHFTLQHANSTHVEQALTEVFRRDQEQSMDFYRINYYGLDTKGKMVYEVDYEDKVRAEFVSAEPDSFYVDIVEGKRYASCLYMPDGKQQIGFAVRFCLDQNGLWVKQMQDIPPAQKIIPMQKNILRERIYFFSRVVHLGSEGEDAVIDFMDTARAYLNPNDEMQLISGECQPGALYVAYLADLPLRKLFYEKSNLRIFQFVPASTQTLHFVRYISYKQMSEREIVHPQLKKPHRRERSYPHEVTYARVFTNMGKVRPGKAELTINPEITVKAKFIIPLSRVISFSGPVPDNVFNSVFTPIGAFKDGSSVVFKPTTFGKVLEARLENRPVVPNLVRYRPKKYCLSPVDHYFSATSICSFNAENTVYGYFQVGTRDFMQTEGQAREGQLYVRYRPDKWSVKVKEKYYPLYFFAKTEKTGSLAVQRVGLFADRVFNSNRQAPLYYLYPILEKTIDEKGKNLTHIKVDYDSPLPCNIDPLILLAGKYTLNSPYLLCRSNKQTEAVITLIKNKAGTVMIEYNDIPHVNIVPEQTKSFLPTRSL